MATATLWLSKNLERFFQRDRQNLRLSFNRAAIGALLEVGAKLAVERQDHLAIGWVKANLAWQREQRQDILERDRCWVHRAEQTCSARLKPSVVIVHAFLHIRTEPTRFELHIESSLGMLTKNSVPRRGLEQLDCVLHGEFIWRNVIGDTCPLIVLALSAL